VEISGRLLVKRRSLADFFCEDVVVALRGGQGRLLCALARVCVCFFFPRCSFATTDASYNLGRTRTVVVQEVRTS
jgi:hypothetical protein